jgi:hypothetical protein
MMKVRYKTSSIRGGYSSIKKYKYRDRADLVHDVSSVKQRVYLSEC